MRQEYERTGKLVVFSHTHWPLKNLCSTETGDDGKKNLLQEGYMRLTFELVIWRNFNFRQITWILETFFINNNNFGLCQCKVLC
jgi:hypothetical protein